MTTRSSFSFALALFGAAAFAPAQQGGAATPTPTPAVATQDTPSFATASADLQQQLVAAMAELAATRERITAEKLPMGARRSLYEALLATLRSQLRAANELMAKLMTPEDRLATLVRAVGHLQGLQPSDPLETLPGE